MSAVALSLSLILPMRLLFVSPIAANEKQPSLGGTQAVHPDSYVFYVLLFLVFLVIQSVLPNSESPFRGSCCFASFQMVSLRFWYPYLLAVLHPHLQCFFREQLGTHSSVCLTVLASFPKIMSLAA